MESVIGLDPLGGGKGPSIAYQARATKTSSSARRRSTSSARGR